MFFKYFCCRESLLANITIGEIKNRESSGSPALCVNVSLTLGSIRGNTDFLYLQPQIEGKSFDTQSRLANSSTATSTRNAKIGAGNQEDRDPLPKRLKDVKKERVLLIEKNSALCENTGTAYVDLSIEKGKYKLYYLRIENE